MAAYKVVFVLGGPGAGKGTQCEKILENFGYVHLSAGDLLRQERNSGSANGDMINNYISEGKIVPVEVTVNLLKNAMVSSGKKHFLIDGFPRNQDNLTGWNTVMGGDAEVERVLFFDCPEEICLQRALERGKSSGRVDDNEDAFKKRIRTYMDSTVPIIDHYKKLNMVDTVSTVPAPDDVFINVAKIFEKAC